MRVMVLVKASKDSEAGIMPAEELLVEMGHFNEKLIEAGLILSGEGLQPSSKGVRIQFSGDQRKVVDGPFAETKELVAGFWIWKVASMEEAIEWAKKCPNPTGEEGCLEIRPIFEVEDFGEALTPEVLRQEAGFRAVTHGLEQPRFVHGPAMTIVGLNASYDKETRNNIPSQWQQFAPLIGKVPGQVDGMTAYGVCWKFQDNCKFDYLAGVEVSNPESLLDGMTTVHVPASEYAVFTYPGHVSQLPQAIDTIWSKWLPESGLKAGSTPAFEKYSEEYNPETGTGGMEIWVPLQP